MEKLDRPISGGGWFGEGDIVDAELLVDLLETYRFGKANVPAGKIRSMVAAATAPAPDNTKEMENDEDDNGSQGNKSVRESTSSDSDPISLESSLSETGSNHETGSNNESSSNNETGFNDGEITISETGSSESSSTNLPNGGSRGLIT
ncbi:unnamed protein product [Arabis nemorensis]|uniref:Uncharacterized protein n=1 Tax=Arabis nemorensis TaxID=586526 RepID=A0A565CUH6_9BRAS|nr:unnamed protein product [Arabis nemorensis]